MSELPKDLMEQVVKWIEDFLPSIFSAGLAFAISYLMGIRDGKPRMHTFIGSLVCGLFVLAIGSSLELIGLPGNAVLFAGGMVGFYGADGIKERVISFGNRKTGGAKSE